MRPTKIRSISNKARINNKILFSKKVIKIFKTTTFCLHSKLVEKIYNICFSYILLISLNEK